MKSRGVVTRTEGAEWKAGKTGCRITPRTHRASLGEDGKRFCYNIRLPSLGPSWPGDKGLLTFWVLFADGQISVKYSCAAAAKVVNR